MKLSKREKIFISILFVVLLTYIFYKFVFLKSIFNISDLESEHENVLNSYETMTQNIKMKKDYEEKEEGLKYEIEKLNILPAIYQEKVIDLLDKLILETNIKVYSIDFTEIIPLLTDENENKSESTEDLTELKNEIILMTVNIEFTSNYDELLLFIDKIQNNSYNIAITNIQILSQNESEIKCIIDISFYAII
jgi:Tfp pilus assembly protein PilO